MEKKYIEKPTQENKILKALSDAKGEWINGQYFLRSLLLSQYHARIWGLQRKGFNIEASEFTDGYGFKSYRLIIKDEVIKE